MMLKTVCLYFLLALTVVAQNSDPAPVEGAMPNELEQDAAIKEELEQLEQAIEKPKKPLFELDFNRSQFENNDSSDQVWAEMSVRSKQIIGRKAKIIPSVPTLASWNTPKY